MSSSSTSPIAVVTGANSGIGRATAIHLASHGYVVYGTVRSIDRATKAISMAEQAGVTIDWIELDIADDLSVKDGFAQILQDAGRVDVMVNNAGVGGNAVVEECPPALYQEVMNINLCGAVRCIQEVLPGMRQRNSGCIVNVSSVVGRFAALGQAPYVASKWALEAMSEALAQEIAPFGIRVAIVEPGITKSAIFAKNIDAPNSTGVYDAHYRRLFQFYAAGMAQSTQPTEVAEVILHAIQTASPQLRYPVSWGAVEMLSKRPNVSDADWVALGAIIEDSDYIAEFKRLFGVDIAVK
ncbi:MAG: SDR family oxidoreductase [Ilumatobacteraceae bacterium]|jgi:NAD(P)-dependent dehydrogenase (short-subunit alcohol dehydrogenase family)|nr:SDR family oxidoreductase [Ilumatobacteraceae bacterium]MBJ7486968.1 SDR family oxidoreductase [Ilumatobacteraceae bacterium]